MAPSLASALGASEASLLEMTSAYSAFPNKGIRIQPHMIRKVYSRDGTLLEEWEKESSKVTSEYVALTMVELMRGVVSGGTASGASAAGQPLAGKTGTVNDHTDVWFIGFTPTYVTGVWMGNPERKESLVRGMTGGVGALPFFNAFMNSFMKDKPKESFPKTPPMPSEIRALMERNRREELEKLEKAEQASIRSGASLAAAQAIKETTDPAVSDGTTSDPNVPGITENDDPVTNAPGPPPMRPPVSRPPVSQPPVKSADPPPADKPEGGKRKGKKGEG